MAGNLPVVLIDGLEIVKTMIDKRFGIEVEEIPIYKNAIDLVMNIDSWLFNSNGL